ncbi:glycosyltransferase [Halioxenophilus sp. WMMB6]|uniref:glycosyltransferase n=1 Tax=Halioxenophilus sp. WMMB6 TaxID=3073815 RepID=UPI00295ECEEB|nr:glycosyltransferase [Halioxenophilus sp. WMMB6]
MRILHVAHQQLRKYGHNRVSWAQKLYFGLIRSGHCVQAFSDRDVAAFEAPLGIRELGRKKANKRLLQTIEAFEPELIIVGHCDTIDNATLEAARTIRPGVVITGCNNDPLFVPDNVAKIEQRVQVVDSMFVSTGVSELAPFTNARAKLWHMPNPVDSSIETFDSSTHDELPIDLLFCSKETAYTQRGELVAKLMHNLPEEFVFKTPGSFGEPGVWGRDYDRTLAASKMGLNLNRQEGLYWYSSARMAQLVGNGLLTFTHSGGRFDELLPPETLVYFSDVDELEQQLRDFFYDNAKRRYWASRAREFFHKEINATLYAQYIVEASMGLPFSHDYVWHR